MLASDVPAGTLKSVLDVWNSFHSVPVVERDRDKLCFVTQWGCYRYKVAPQGYLASGDAYCHRFSEIAKGIENRRTIIDDTVIWGDTLSLLNSPLLAGLCLWLGPPPPPHHSSD